jgi:hypothetical protein
VWSCTASAAQRIQASRRKPATTATEGGAMQLQLQLQLQLRCIRKPGVDVVGRDVGRVELKCKYNLAAPRRKPTTSTTETVNCNSQLQLQLEASCRRRGSCRLVLVMWLIALAN